MNSRSCSKTKLYVDYGSCAIIDPSLSCSNILTIDGVDYEEMDSAPLVSHSSSPDPPPPPPPATTTTTTVVVETGIDWFRDRVSLNDSCCEENVVVKNVKVKDFPARNSRFFAVFNELFSEWLTHWPNSTWDGVPFWN